MWLIIQVNEGTWRLDADGTVFGDRANFDIRNYSVGTYRRSDLQTADETVIVAEEGSTLTVGDSAILGPGQHIVYLGARADGRTLTNITPQSADEEGRFDVQLSLERQ